MNQPLLDSYDIRLLKALQQNDSQPLHALADIVKLSTSQCSRRINRLKDQGFIARQVTLLNPRAVGLNLEAFITVALDSHNQEQTRMFQDKVATMPAVLECYAITGGHGDYLLKVIVTDQQALSDFLMKSLMPLSGIARIKTSLVLTSIKHTTELPLP